MDPYSTPSEVSAAVAPTREPKAIKVFGILHLVFGFLTLPVLILSFVFIFLAESIFGLLAEVSAEAPDSEESVEMMNLLGSTFADQMGYYVVSLIISLVLTVLLLRAGFALVKRRKGAVAKSVLWSWAVIAYVVISVPVSFFYLGQSQRETTRRIEELSGSPASSSSGAGGIAEQVGTSVLGAIFYLIYPVLVLVLLNRPQVRDYLSRFGK